MDQYLVAALFLIAFAAFVVVAYITNEERKSRRSEPNESDGWLR